MAEPQEYTIESFTPWIDRETGNAVKDPHGNIKGSVLFIEDKAEPIDATFKAMPSPGDKKYGIVDLYQTRAGSTRKGFKSAPRPQPGYGVPVQAGQVAAAKYPKNDEHTQESIARSVALKAAVDFMGEGGFLGTSKSVSNVLGISDAFLAWLQGNAPQSGIEKARAIASTLRRDERDEDNDIRSLVENSEPVDYEEIPPEYR